MSLNSLLRQAVKLYPDVRPLLSDKARFYMYQTTAYKTYDYMLKQIIGLVRGVYSGNVGGQFIDTMASLISGQLTQAYEQAWKDEGDGSEFPEYLNAPLEDEILKQYDFVDGFYRAIVDARIDKTSIDPLLVRAELWANAYSTAYENATSIITAETGGKEEWVLGATEEHCPECADLNGIVAFAKEWDTLNVRPKNPPNNKLTCGGWRCDCERRPTDKRRSPNAYGRIEEIMLGR